MASESSSARTITSLLLPGIWPGLALTGAIAGAGLALRELPLLGLFSPMILAILIGLAWHNFFGTPAIASAGIAFALRPVLRVAIMLLGLQLTAEQIAEVGTAGFAVIITTVAACFLFTSVLGRLMGVDRGLTELIAAGTSICGASAIIATNSVTRASDEDVAYAMACITLFGSIAMFGYPLLQSALGLDAHAYGLWAGASIHEVSQAVAAAYQVGQEAGEAGTIAKLSRVILLAPIVLALGYVAGQRRQADDSGAATGAPVPWFVLGFIAMIGLNSVIDLPPEFKAVLTWLTTFLLSMALAAMGLVTDIRKLRGKGLRPLLLGFAAFAFIASFSLMLVKITG